MFRMRKRQVIARSSTRHWKVTVELSRVGCMAGIFLTQSTYHRLVEMQKICKGFALGWRHDRRTDAKGSCTVRDFGLLLVRGDDDYNDSLQ